jgi:hypothetical protein
MELFLRRRDLLRLYNGALALGFDGALAALFFPDMDLRAVLFHEAAVADLLSDPAV